MKNGHIPPVWDDTGWMGGGGGPRGIGKRCALRHSGGTRNC